ncbi:MAG: dihydrofolate reductase family protein [Chloroflexi bacterium]|nr:dihydrofolate reductase family protein [Chloroflexota bacterium]
MRKIIACEFLTLDGVMEASEQWQPAYVTEDVAEVMTSHILGADGTLLGRVTYEMFVGYWPLQTHNEFGIADKLNSEPKYVVSSTLQKADWNNTTVIKGNVAEEIVRLKQQPGGYIRLVGSATLVQSLTGAGLIDEFWLLVHPLVRGRGRRLFNEAMETISLKLVEARPFRSGVALLRYQPKQQE